MTQCVELGPLGSQHTRDDINLMLDCHYLLPGAYLPFQSTSVSLVRPCFGQYNII